MSLHEEIEAAVNAWNNGLDNGDIEAVVSTCHPDMVTANDHQPVTVGIQSVRDKYEPRIAAMDITSGYDIETLQVFGDTAVVAGRFYGTMKDKKTGDVRTPEGRLILVYQRDAAGAWKMILDIDNNGPA